MTLLQVEGLGKAFGKLRAVDSVSLTVNEGEIYGLLGPNGAGKTSIISMICGLLTPDTGQILIAGSSLAQFPLKAKSIMGVVPQELALYEELSGRENFVFWGKIAGLNGREARERAAQLLEELALTDRADEAVRRYSGGMKRRINLGCALLHKPKLLLLDEPTVGIDPQARLKILDSIRKVCGEGTGVLYTTHYLEEAETLCNRMGIIDHGKLLTEGTLAEVRSRLGGDQVFVVDADFSGATDADLKGLNGHFRVIQKTDSQIIVAGVGGREPTDSFKDLLKLPFSVQNVSMKRPSLNDVFLQLTGRAVRE